MEAKDMVCIVCPLGCKLKVMKDDKSQTGYSVVGNKCFRGVDYGIKEITNPTRVLTTTVTLLNAPIKRLPVTTSAAIPKHLIMKAMDLINNVEVKVPIKAGQIIIKNLMDTGVDVIASRSMYENFDQENCFKEYLVHS